MNGFCRKSIAPMRMASTATSTVPNAVTIMAGQPGSICLTAPTTSRPPTPSILRSVMTKSAGCFFMRAMPAAPGAARVASCPMRRTVAAIPSRMVSLSSMIRMRAIGRHLSAVIRW